MGNYGGITDKRPLYLVSVSIISVIYSNLLYIPCYFLILHYHYWNVIINPKN